MAMLTIDGVGTVEVGPEFARLSPDQQNATVQEIVASIRGGGAPAPTQSPDTQAALQEEARQNLAATGIRPEGKPGEIVERGAILPFGVDQQGNVSLALPEFLEGPRRTIMDLLEGRRTVQEVSGKEIFELGALFANPSAAGGTGAGIARAGVQRAAERTAEAAAPPAVNQTARLASELATESRPPPVTAPAAPAAPAAVEAQAGRGGLHSTAETLALRGQAKEGFKVLDDAGVVIKPESFGPLTQRIFSEAAREGMDVTLTPSSNAAVKRLTELADTPITLQSLDVMRKVASAAAGAPAAADRRIAEMVLGRLDDFVQGLTAKDLQLGTGAEAQAVAKALPQARKVWSEALKLETINRLVTRAQDTVANRPQLGIENTLRTEFSQLVKNDRMMRTFTPDERAAIRAITKGKVKALSRNLGRLAPTGGSLPLLAIGGTSAAIGAKIGLDPLSSTVVLGPPIAGAAMAGRKLAAVLTQRGIKNLEDIIRKGGGSQSANEALTQGRSLFETLAGQINTAAQAQAVQPEQRRR